MKVVILAGGFGTRISEESGIRPKPMVEVGGRPILWHIMKIYSHYGHSDFIICCGYKANYIKEYFSNYFLHMSDVTFDMENNSMEVHRKNAEKWRVTLVDTGENTMTGGRLKRVRDYLGDKTFCMTYGDGVSDVNIPELIRHHESAGVLATLTAIRQHGRFGVFNLHKGDDKIHSFKEKPEGDGDESAWINGGFFVLEPEVLDYIAGDEISFEKEPLELLSTSGQLSAFKHTGFWQPMDTLRDRMQLEKQWAEQKAPWKIWEEK